MTDTLRQAGKRQHGPAGKREVELPEGVTAADWGLERVRVQNPSIRSYLGCIRLLEEVLDSNYAILHCSPERLLKIWRQVEEVNQLMRSELLPTLEQPSVVPAPRRGAPPRRDHVPEPREVGARDDGAVRPFSARGSAPRGEEVPVRLDREDPRLPARQLRGDRRQRSPQPARRGLLPVEALRPGHRGVRVALLGGVRASTSCWTAWRRPARPNSRNCCRGCGRSG